jgi:hypothetical protein
MDEKAKNIIYHGQTQYQVGDFVEITTGYETTIICQIINVINTYPEITYVVKKNDKIMNCTRHDFLNYTKISIKNLRIGIIVNVEHNKQNIDGTIVNKKLDGSKIIYIIRFIDEVEEEYLISDINYPMGYFIQ